MQRMITERTLERYTKGRI